MRLRALVSASVVALALTFPPTAAAQVFVGTVHGTITEQFPSGGTGGFTNLTFQRIAADGATFIVKTISQCFGGATVDCVTTQGDNSRTFTATEIPIGPTLMNISGTSFVSKSVSFSNNGGGHIAVQAMPRLFNVSASLADIPAGGGAIPVTISLSRRWANPFPIPIPIVARLRLQTTNSALTNDSSYKDVLSVPVVLPPDFTSYNQVVMTAIPVPGGENAGASYCVQLEITVPLLPDTVIASAADCSNKRP